jgi:hypothetical protein
MSGLSGSEAAAFQFEPRDPPALCCASSDTAKPNEYWHIEEGITRLGDTKTGYEGSGQRDHYPD